LFQCLTDCLPISDKPQGMYSPVQLGSIGELKNRMALASLTRSRNSEDGVPTEMVAEYYVQRASAGVILAEATAISAEGYGWFRSPGIYTPEQIAGWQQVTSKVHEAGGKIVLQLWHMGRQSHSDYLEMTGCGGLPVSASAIAAAGDTYVLNGVKKDYETPRALETSELPRLVQDYAQAARNAMQAGFDGVEIHAANGYLLDQFLQTKTNQRSDEYGGSVENRYRLLGEVIEAVAAAVGGADKVGVKLSPNGVFGDMGCPEYEAQFDHTIQKCAEAGLAYVQLMDGLAFGFHELGAPYTLERAAGVLERAQGGRRRATLLMGNCGHTRETAEAAIEAGNADLISFGRPYIANPDLPERFQSGAPLAECGMEHWYPQDGGAEGYTNFPSAAAAKDVAAEAAGPEAEVAISA